MTRINLLPWREARRAQQQRNFIGLIAVAIVVAALGVVLTHLYIAGLIENQEARNQYLRNEIAKLRKVEEEINEMKRSEERLLARLESIQRLQQSRPEPVNVLDTLVRRLPEDMYLSLMQSEGRQITLKGNARINNVVSDFMRELEQSELFGVPSLRVIERKTVFENVPASEFELVVNRVSQTDEEEENAATGDVK
jgi:type IV pilus assembly protein PilN